jgi:flagellum-specific peptidoglycan hydrolase FlgJ
MNTKEHDGEKMTDTKASFRRFNDLSDYIKYKLDLLGNSNYNVFSYNPDQFYTRLVTAKNKYATDPDYVDKMNRMYNEILRYSA